MEKNFRVIFVPNLRNEPAIIHLEIYAIVLSLWKGYLTEEHAVHSNSSFENFRDCKILRGGPGDLLSTGVLDLVKEKMSGIDFKRFWYEPFRTDTTSPPTEKSD